MHGAKAGRKPTHGRYTKAAIERRGEMREEVRAIIRSVRELIDEA
jgi:hypothetical protein